MNISSVNKRKEQDRVGVPDVKKIERTGENSFVIHTKGKDYYEGKYDSRKYDIKNGKFVNK